MFEAGAASFTPGARVLDPSLGWLCLLLFVDGATLSIATTPVLLHYGQSHPPLLVAVLGGTASALGSAVQLFALRAALSSNHAWTRRFAPSRERVDQALRSHPSASFIALAVARATPLPDMPLKIVAAAVRYPISLYTLAVLIGSLPYYFALAWLGHVVRFPVWLLVAAVGVVLIAILADRIRRRSAA
ncbi:MAG TPA: VTT domain-containing protein [Candidatus Udaeobacter sp.]|nr:VTT domain-containing protein [Candidatus Udaeobacter sp.]